MNGPSYTIRPATREDLDAVAALILACDMADWGSPDYSAERVLDDWDLPGLDLATDTWLVQANEDLVGYAWLFARDEHRRVEGWQVVSPEHRHRGVPELLLDRMEGRAAEHATLAEAGPVVVAISAIAPDRKAHQLLEVRGYRVARHFWRMDARIDPAATQPDVPDGIVIRRFARGRDERPVHATFDEAFVGHWGFIPLPFDEWSALRIEWEGFDPDLWFVAREGDEIVGALAGRIIDETGWVSTLAVRPGWRGRGIAESLLGYAFAAFAGRGIRSGSLFVDAENPTGATALYEKVGMHVARQYDWYERTVGTHA